MTKILVADDHDLVRMGIVRMLCDVDTFDVVGDVNNGEDAIRFVRDNDVDVVLMDLKMPGCGGIEATRKILSYNSQINIIIVTSLSGDVFPEKLVKAGARGYITKGADFNEVIDAVDKVMSGKLYISRSVAQQLAMKSVGNDTSPFNKLSDRELQTVMFIVEGKKVQSIADAFSVSPKTINSYRYRIFDKLRLSNDVELAILAVKHKLLDIESFS